MADTTKSGNGAVFTTSVAVVVRVRPPLVPEIVSVVLAAGVFAAVVTVNVELPAPVSVAGLKVAVALAGNPAMARSTGSANPLSAVVVTVYVVPPPCVTVREPGAAAIEKSGDGGAVGTICTAFTGARLLPEDAPGVAVSVNPPATMLNFTKLPAEAAASVNVALKLVLAASVRLIVVVVIPGPLMR